MRIYMLLLAGAFVAAKIPVFDPQETALVEILDVGKYPGYEGDEITGTAKVLMFKNKSVGIGFVLAGLPEGCKNGPAAGVPNSCGVHIHSGKSCASHEETGGHFFGGVVRGDNSFGGSTSALGGTIKVVNEDPWKDVVYNADDNNKADQYVIAAIEKEYHETINHVLVIHDYDGKRATCQVIYSQEYYGLIIYSLGSFIIFTFLVVLRNTAVVKALGKTIIEMDFLPRCALSALSIALWGTFAYVSHMMGWGGAIGFVVMWAVVLLAASLYLWHRGKFKS